MTKAHEPSRPRAVPTQPTLVMKKSSLDGATQEADKDSEPTSDQIVFFHVTHLNRGAELPIEALSPVSLAFQDTVSMPAAV